MAKQFKQFRYYSEPNVYYKDNLNAPDFLTQHHLASGSIFNGTNNIGNPNEEAHNYFPISKLGIQSLPGTKFYLNDNTQPVIIGMTGTFELDLKDNIEITALTFDNESINMIRDNHNAYLIIDIIYEEGEE